MSTLTHKSRYTCESVVNNARFADGNEISNGLGKCRREGII